MKKSKISFFAAIIVTAFCFISFNASAQPGGDDGNCSGDLETCKRDFETCQNASLEILGVCVNNTPCVQACLDAGGDPATKIKCVEGCSGGAPKAPPAKPRTVTFFNEKDESKVVLYGTPVQCLDPEKFVPMVGKEFREIRCVAKGVYITEMASRVNALEVKYGELLDGLPDSYPKKGLIQRMLGDIGRIELRLNEFQLEHGRRLSELELGFAQQKAALNILCPSRPDVPDDDWAKRCSGVGTQQRVYFAMDGQVMGIYRGTPGLCFSPAIALELAFFFTKESPVFGYLGGSMGLGLGDQDTGLMFPWSVSTGVGLNVTEKREHSLKFGGRFMQYIGIDGADEHFPESGRGYSIGPELGYRFNFLTFGHLGATAGLGYGRNNFLEEVGTGRFEPKADAGFNAWFGLNFGWNIDFGSWDSSPSTTSTTYVESDPPPPAEDTGSGAGEPAPLPTDMAFRMP